MAIPFRERLRRLWLDLHLWVGAGLFVLLVPLGLSGAALTFEPELDRVLHPARYGAGGPAVLPPSAYFAVAQDAFDGRVRPTQLRMPQAPGDPVVVSGRRGGDRPSGLSAWIAPASGRVLEVGDPRASILGFAHQLHGQFFIPGWGRQAVGWLGWAMVFNCCSGLWLWQPRHGPWLKALRWRRSPSVFNNLHHMVGFWVAIPLAVLSLTGVYIAFPQTSHALFGAPPPPVRGAEPGRRDRPHEPGSGGGPRLDVDQAVALALQAHPGAARPLAVSVDGRSGALTPAAARGEGGGDPLSRTVRQVHDGDDTGLVWRSIIALAGTAPTVLGISGIVMWLRRRSRRAHLRHPTPAQA